MLEKFHELILRALKEDDETAPGKDKPNNVRGHFDWKAVTNEIESEMRNRNLFFKTIKF